LGNEGAKFAGTEVENRPPRLDVAGELLFLPRFLSSEALALEVKHFVNNGQTIVVSQQVDRDTPRIVRYLKTDACTREIEVSTEVAEFLRGFITGKSGLLFETRNSTPYLHNNQRWLTPRRRAMGIDEKGMGFHAFRRFRKRWLRGERCQEDISNFWMGHQPETMSELYFGRRRL
jgi:hypothetical protein